MNRLYIYVRMFFLIGCVSLFTSCGNDILDGIPVYEGTLSFVISEGNVQDGRASVDDAAMRTLFETGDKAGVFAVCDGRVVDGFQNLQLTYNANGMWQPTEEVVYCTDMENYTFYAYFPYREDVVFNAAEENPFQEAVQGYEFMADQSSKVLFNRADFMVTSACSIDVNFHSVNLMMEHVGSLVTVELPNSSYVFENVNPVVEPYVMAKAENVTFFVDDVEVSPYFDEQVQSYRLILKTGEAGCMRVEYINNGIPQKVNIDNLKDIAQGQYATYVVDGGVRINRMLLQVGDFFLADGNIISKDVRLTDVQKSQVIGIVYKLGTTETIVSANANWNHAMVIGLTEQQGMKWGTSNAPDGAKWYQPYGLSDLGNTTASNVNLDVLSATGYEHTLAWEQVYKELAFASEFHAVRNNQQENVPASAMSTVWFVPSIREWMDIQESGNDVMVSLVEVGGNELKFPVSNPGYWSTDLRSGSSAWCYTGNASANSIYARGFKDSATFRFILAF